MVSQIGSNSALSASAVKRRLNIKSIAPNPNVECWYRCVDHKVGGKTVVELCEYEVLRHTPMGVRVKTGVNSTRVVLHHSFKKFAHPTPEDAIEGFTHRKYAQISILRRRLKQAADALVEVSIGNISRI